MLESNTKMYKPSGFWGKEGWCFFVSLFCFFGGFGVFFSHTGRCNLDRVFLPLMLFSTSYNCNVSLEFNFLSCFLNFQNFRQRNGSDFFSLQ